jgi:hypothetical protein
VAVVAVVVFQTALELLAVLVLLLFATQAANVVQAVQLHLLADLLITHLHHLVHTQANHG